MATNNAWNTPDLTTDGNLLIGKTGFRPVANTLTSGTNINIVNGPGSITIDTTGFASLTWINVTGTTQTIAPFKGYFANNGSQVVFTLPATAAFGDSFFIAGLGAGGWSIAQNAGQTIHQGVYATTTGTGGSLSSTNQYDSIFLVCGITNTDFYAVIAPQGNLDFI